MSTASTLSMAARIGAGTAADTPDPARAVEAVRGVLRAVRPELVEVARITVHRPDSGEVVVTVEAEGIVKRAWRHVPDGRTHIVEVRP